MPCLHRPRRRPACQDLLHARIRRTTSSRRRLTSSCRSRSGVACIVSSVAPPLRIPCAPISAERISSGRHQQWRSPMSSSRLREHAKVQAPPLPSSSVPESRVDLPFKIRRRPHRPRHRPVRARVSEFPCLKAVRCSLKIADINLQVWRLLSGGSDCSSPAAATSQWPPANRSQYKKCLHEICIKVPI